VKKKTGIVLDERGNIISKAEDEEEKPSNEKGATAKNQKQYTPINNYKPTGNLIYGKEMFEKLEKKVNMS
jgi:hypothetical protein